MTVPQILAAIVTCAVMEVAITFRRQHAFVWPASAMLTGSGVALILRVPSTPVGDHWSFHAWWVFAGVAAFSLSTKYLIRYRGSHVFNPSNIGLVVVFIVFGSTRLEPLDFWWAPLGTGMILAYAVILIGGLLITAAPRAPRRGSDVLAHACSGPRGSRCVRPLHGGAVGVRASERLRLLAGDHDLARGADLPLLHDHRSEDGAQRQGESHRVSSSWLQSRARSSWRRRRPSSARRSRSSAGWPSSARRRPILDRLRTSRQLAIGRRASCCRAAVFAVFGGVAQHRHRRRRRAGARHRRPGRGGGARPRAARRRPGHLPVDHRRPGRRRLEPRDHRSRGAGDRADPGREPPARERRRCCRNDVTILEAVDHGDRLDEMQRSAAATMRRTARRVVEQYQIDDVNVSCSSPFGKQDGLSLGLESRGTVTDGDLRRRRAPARPRRRRRSRRPSSMRRATGDRWLNVAVLPISASYLTASGGHCHRAIGTKQERRQVAGEVRQAARRRDAGRCRARRP